MSSNVGLAEEALYDEKMNEKYFYSLANAGLGIAKDIANIKPDCLVIPLNDGLVVYKIVMQALRKNLNVSSLDYDPIKFFIPAGWEDNRKGGTYRNEITNEVFDNYLKRRMEYEKKGPFKELMIIDAINTGTSMRCILSKTLKTLKKVAGKIYVSCISTDRNYFNKGLRQLNVVDKYQKPDLVEKFFFHDADIAEIRYFDDNPKVIGIDMMGPWDERLNDDVISKRQITFFPNLDDIDTSRRFYYRIYKALEKSI
jgi:hypothetical protein